MALQNSKRLLKLRKSQEIYISVMNNNADCVRKVLVFFFFLYLLNMLTFNSIDKFKGILSLFWTIYYIAHSSVKSANQCSDAEETTFVVVRQLIYSLLKDN